MIYVLILAGLLLFVQYLQFRGEKKPRQYHDPLTPEERKARQERDKALWAEYHARNRR